MTLSTGVRALKGAGKMTRLLALDGIQDPGNLGTLVRTALALGGVGAHSTHAFAFKPKHAA